MGEEKRETMGTRTKQMGGRGQRGRKMWWEIMKFGFRCDKLIFALNNAAGKGAGGKDSRTT